LPCSCRHVDSCIRQDTVTVSRLRRGVSTCLLILCRRQFFPAPPNDSSSDAKFARSIQLEGHLSEQWTRANMFLLGTEPSCFCLHLIVAVNKNRAINLNESRRPQDKTQFFEFRPCAAVNLLFLLKMFERFWSASLWLNQVKCEKLDRSANDK
jgi:hypothetical protein